MSEWPPLPTVWMVFITVNGLHCAPLSAPPTPWELVSGVVSAHFQGRTERPQSKLKADPELSACQSWAVSMAPGIDVFSSSCPGTVTPCEIRDWG